MSEKCQISNTFSAVRGIFFRTVVIPTTARISISRLSRVAPSALLPNEEQRNERQKLKQKSSEKKNNNTRVEKCADYADVIEVIDEWRPAIGSNSAANIFEGNIGTVLFRDARYRWRAPDFPEFAFMISLQLAIFGRERKGQSWQRTGQGQGLGRNEFCRFVTLQCINERTFIKAETVFSAAANCRHKRACPCRSTSSISIPRLFPATRCFSSKNAALLSHPLLYGTEFYVNSWLLFQDFVKSSLMYRCQHQ